MFNSKVIALPVIILTTLYFQSCGLFDSSTEVSYYNIASGNLSGAGDEGITRQNIVIADIDSWKELLTKMNSVNDMSYLFNETSVDFSKYIVLAAFSDVKPNSGYSVSIKKISKDSETIYVTVENSVSNGTALAVISQPFNIVKIDMQNAKIIFEEQE